MTQPQMLTRRSFLLGALGVLVAHHRPGHRGKPTPTSTPTPILLSSDLYSDVYMDIY